MSTSELLSESVKLPEGVKAQLEASTLVLSGKGGKVSRSFDARTLKMEVKGSEVVLQSVSVPMINTYKTHVMNMAKGAGEGYSVLMKTVHSHFPMSFEVKGRELLVKNFLGEKMPRHAPIAGEVKLEAKGQEVRITGASKDDVGQTVANIKTALRIRKRDSRVFQDGLYVTEE
ncbi:MAG: 50S ribosomal protein L6 [Candidatus Burarchaeum sp.]|nr:50S ribosomal protein L6 [Candidatus Burarchaeum sp.]MDO8339375.1 50S ribosomal protein L6 [Candidatus Burarchaeum sp.]